VHVACDLNIISRVTIQSIERKRVLEQTCRIVQVPVCVSVSPPSELWKTADWIRMPFGVVNGVVGTMGLLDSGEDRQRGRGSLGVNVGISLRPMGTL